MQKNQVITGVVNAYGSSGEGIIKQDGMAIFVPYAMPGEKVTVQILKVSKKVAFAKILEIHTPAEDRVRPRCSVYYKCGGCSIMHLAYKTQLTLKRDTVHDCLKKIAFIDADVPLTVESEKRFGYRNKLQLPIRNTPNGIKIGFFAENSHRIVETDDCPLHPEWIKKLIAELKIYIGNYCVPVYSDITHEGSLKHIVVKEQNGEFLVILVSATDKLVAINEFDSRLNVIFPNHSLFLNVNKSDENVILGDKFIKISGKGLINSSLCGINYTVGPASFMQINDDVKTKIYSKVSELTAAFAADTVIDAYCGSGLLTAMLAKKSKAVVGIEIVEEAVELARTLARDNLISNAQFVCAPCEKALPEIIKKAKKSGGKTLLVLDPPRKGIDAAVIKAICENRPDGIIYISCSPQSLSRDLGLLAGTLAYEGTELKKAVDSSVSVKNVLPSGYYIDYVCPYDMFPQTRHVETLVSLVLKDKKD